MFKIEKIKGTNSEQKTNSLHWLTKSKGKLSTIFFSVFYGSILFAIKGNLKQMNTILSLVYRIQDYMPSSFFNEKFALYVNFFTYLIVKQNLPLTPKNMIKTLALFNQDTSIFQEFETPFHAFHAANNNDYLKTLTLAPAHVLPLPLENDLKQNDFILHFDINGLPVLGLVFDTIGEITIYQLASKSRTIIYLPENSEKISRKEAVEYFEIEHVEKIEKTYTEFLETVSEEKEKFSKRHEIAEAKLKKAENIKNETADFCKAMNLCNDISELKTIRAESRKKSAFGTRPKEQTVELSAVYNTKLVELKAETKEAEKQAQPKETIKALKARISKIDTVTACKMELSIVDLLKASDKTKEDIKKRLNNRLQAIEADIKKAEIKPKTKQIISVNEPKIKTLQDAQNAIIDMFKQAYTATGGDKRTVLALKADLIKRTKGKTAKSKINQAYKMFEKQITELTNVLTLSFKAERTLNSLEKNFKAELKTASPFVSVLLKELYQIAKEKIENRK